MLNDACTQLIMQRIIAPPLSSNSSNPKDTMRKQQKLLNLSIVSEFMVERWAIVSDQNLEHKPEFHLMLCWKDKVKSPPYHNFNWRWDVIGNPINSINSLASVDEIYETKKKIFNSCWIRVRIYENDIRLLNCFLPREKKKIQSHTKCIKLALKIWRKWPLKICKKTETKKIYTKLNYVCEEQISFC